jgi:hypothetical protein
MTLRTKRFALSRCPRWHDTDLTITARDENGRKTSQLFSTSTFEYENKSKSSKVGHEKEHELMEYQEFQKRTNLSGIMSNTVGI